MKEPGTQSRSPAQVQGPKRCDRQPLPPSSALGGSRNKRQRQDINAGMMTWDVSAPSGILHCQASAPFAYFRFRPVTLWVVFKIWQVYKTPSMHKFLNPKIQIKLESDSLKSPWGYKALLAQAPIFPCNYGLRVHNHQRLGLTEFFSD